MSGSLSQAEIDAMLKGTGDQAAPSTSNGLDEQTKFDIIGEVGNISMSQAATTLSAILNRRVSITTPRVNKVRFGTILAGLSAPKVAATVSYKAGLVGTNLMLLEVSDATIIADLMMGGDGQPATQQFTELELSAVAEAMNQMIGSASTAMATMFSRMVDILPPSVSLWEQGVEMDYGGLKESDDIYAISFNLSVEGVIESEIMQIFTEEVVADIAGAMLGDTAENIRPPQAAPVAPSAPTPPVQPEPVVVQPTFATPQPTLIATQMPEPPKPSVSVSHAAFQPLTSSGATDGDNLDLILDVPLDLSVVLGKSRKSIKEILALNTGSVVELDKLTEEPLEILVNGKLIATGEVVVINENFGVRITNILSQKQRLHHLH